jgi:Tfp pilus assembly protein PilV
MTTYQAGSGSPPETGWSLIEVLFSIVVLGIGVALFMQMQNRASSMNRTNSNLHTAAGLIEKHVESLREKISQNTAKNWPPHDTSYADEKYSHINLTRTVNEAVSPIDGMVLPGVRKINLVVAWGNQSMDTIRITTYVSKNL